MTTAAATTNTKKRVTIALSEERPVRIDPEEWPVISTADWYSGQYDCQSFDAVWIKVRQHDDGRMLVYGYAGDGRGGGRPGRRTVTAGYQVSADAEETAIVRAVRRVAGVLATAEHCAGDEECDRMAGEVIAGLPAQEMD